MSTILPVELRWKTVHMNEGNIGTGGPTWNQCATTAKLDDFAPGDTTTYERTDEIYSAVSCAWNGAIPRLCVIADFGSVMNFTKFDFQWTFAAVPTGSSGVVPCSPGGTPAVTAGGLDSVERNNSNDGNSTTWVQIFTDTTLTNVTTTNFPTFSTIVGSCTAGITPFNARRIRMMFRYTGQGLPSSAGLFTASILVSDFRLSGQSNTDIISGNEFVIPNLGLGNIEQGEPEPCWDCECPPTLNGWSC